MLRPVVLPIVLLTVLLNCSAALAQFGPLERITPISPAIRDAMAADVDGDGDLDAVVFSSADGNLRWFENDGSGGFPADHLIMEFEPDARFVLTVDVDNNGTIDVIVSRSEYGGEPSQVLLNNGDGSFINASASYPELQNLTRLTAIDMDNDGLLDIVDIQAWHRNHGSGDYSAPFYFPMPEYARITLIADITGDSLPEVFFRTTWNDLRYLVNEEGGVVFQETTFPFELEDAVHAVADMDGDGDMDIITQKRITGASKILVWLENDGQGNLINLHHLTGVVHYPFEIYAANLDDTPEWEVWNQHVEPVLFRADSLLNLNPPKVFEHAIGTGNRLQIGDFNGDGILDMFFKQSLTIAFGNGEAHGWTEAVFFNNPSHCEYFEIVDMDKDGYADIVAGSYKDSYTFEVLRYLGNGEYAARSEVVSYRARNLLSMEVQDYDGNDLPDIGYHEFEHTAFNVAWNFGPNAFAHETLLTEDTVYMSHITVMADFDGDGDNDIIEVFPYEVYWGYQGIDLFRSNGDGTFQRESISTAAYPTAILNRVFDLEGDGDLDMVFLIRGSHSEGIPSGIVLLENDGTGHFEVTFFEDGTMYNYQKLHAHDMDGDGDVDIIITSSNGSNELVAVFEYTPQGYVKHTVYLNGGYDPRVSTVADVDNDGLPDIVCFTGHIDPTEETGLFWFRNLGGMEFDPPYFQNYTEPFMSSGSARIMQLAFQLKAHDRDMDGDDDLFLSDFGTNWGLGSIYYLENLLWGSYRITGNLFLDTDTSGTLGPDDQPFPFVAVQVDPSESAYYTNALGIYNAIVGEGTSTVYPELDEELWTLTTPSSYTVTLDSSNTLETGIDFGVIPNGVQPGGNLEIMDPSVICNTMGWMWFSLQNTGNTILSGVVEVTLDSLIDMGTVTSEADSVVGQTLYFTVDSLYYYDLQQWLIGADMPNEQNIGVPIASHAVYTDVTGLVLESENASELLCAYDPNDKKESTGVGPEGVIEDGQWLRYTVRFQNTGNAPATDVVIRDELSTHLDHSTFTPVSWSHDVETTVEPSGDLVLRFENIMLPDSGSDMAASQGYFCYRIKANTGLMPGTRILNTARIFFDNNPPIITNTTSNMVECYDLGQQFIIQDSITLISPFDNPISQQWFLNGEAIPGAVWRTYRPMLAGSYRVDAIFPVSCKMSSDPFQFQTTGLLGTEPLTARIYPNPTNGVFMVQMSGPVGSDAFLTVSDIAGRTVLRKQLAQATTTVATDGLVSGVFLVYVDREGIRSFLGKVVLSDR